MTLYTKFSKKKNTLCINVIYLLCMITMHVLIKTNDYYVGLRGYSNTKICLFIFPECSIVQHKRMNDSLQLHET